VQLDGYSDIRLVGEGGLGRVYRARRDSTGGVVAIKELQDISAGSPTWHRARRELDALLRLKGHSHVINVEEVIDGPGGPCLIMEYAPGGSLFDRVQTGPLPAPELVLVGQHVCEAMTASHAVGVIHRDIKPHNLLIGAFGQVKVCDFGIASLARDGEARTKTGSLTMAYASPEELDGSDDIGPAADVYSFAATMLHLASGRRPSFQDRVDTSTIDFAITDKALTSSIALLRQALAHKPGDRPSISELSASFDANAYLLGPARIKALEPTPGLQIPEPSVPLQTLVRGRESSPTIVSRTERRMDLPSPSPATIAGSAHQTEGPAVRYRSRSGIVIAAAFALIAITVAAAIALTRDSNETTVVSNANDGTTSVTTVVSQAPPTAAPATTATTVTSVITTPAVTTTTIYGPLQPVLDEDRAIAHTLVDSYVVQLSAKWVGLQELGITYDGQAILEDHLQYRSTYGAILVFAGEFQFKSDGEPMTKWYLTLLPVRFDKRDDALAWCKSQGLKTPEETQPGRVECYGRIFRPPNP